MHTHKKHLAKVLLISTDQFFFVEKQAESYEPRKLVFCICENKDADQLRSNCAADQRLCFWYIDSMISLLSKFEISSL